MLARRPHRSDEPGRMRTSGATHSTNAGRARRHPPRHTRGPRAASGRLALAVDGQLGPVGVEAQKAGDSLSLRDGRLIAPYQVLVDLAADLGRPVGGLALERAGGLVTGGA